MSKNRKTDINNILQERGSRYGSFENHAKICQTLKAVINTNLISLNKHLASDQQQALDVICDKIARMINGDPDYVDNWIDIAGYAKLVSDRLELKT
jgi:GTP-sensing pleiotropic transcriptional regulator CodY